MINADPKRPYKAIYAGIVAGISTAVSVAPDGVTLVEGLGIALAAVVGFGGTYWITNPEGLTDTEREADRNARGE